LALALAETPPPGLTEAKPRAKKSDKNPPKVEAKAGAKVEAKAGAKVEAKAGAKVEAKAEGERPKPDAARDDKKGPDADRRRPPSSRSTARAFTRTHDAWRRPWPTTT
jgi:hypothetical protein